MLKRHLTLTLTLTLTLIKGEIVPSEDSLYETVISFATHAMIAAVGGDRVRERVSWLSEQGSSGTDVVLSSIGKGMGMASVRVRVRVGIRLARRVLGN
jgi:hypothetical protein